MTEKKNETPRIIKAGGAKGDAVVALLDQDPSLTRAQLAAEVGCTVNRVGEVVRFLRDHGTKEQKAVIAKHVKAQPTKAVQTEEPKPTPAKATRSRKQDAPQES